MIDILMRTVTAPWPVYAVVISVVAWFAWAVGRGGLKDERALRMAAEADAREGEFAVGRAEVQATTIDALTRALPVRDLPPREGIVLPDRTLTMPTVAAQEGTALAADFPPPANVDPTVERMICDPTYGGAVAVVELVQRQVSSFPAVAYGPSLAELTVTSSAVPGQADIEATMAAMRHDTVNVLRGARGEPPLDPEEPLEVVIVPDADEPPEQPEVVAAAAGRRRDDDPPAGGGRAEPLCSEVVAPRYRWAHLSGEQLPEPGPWRAPVEWMRRAGHAAARFRRQRPDVRLAWAALALLPPVRHWLARMLASSLHTARHAARRGAESWADHRDALSARWYEERQSASRRLRYLIADQTGAHWSLVLPEMRAALRPPKRTVLPSLPSLGCTP